MISDGRGRSIRTSRSTSRSRTSAQVDTKVDTTSRSRYYPGLAHQSLDPAMVGKLRVYADKHIAAGSRRATESAIANIEYRMKVRNERLPQIDAWLGKNGG